MHIINSNIYKIMLDNYESYKTGEYIAFIVDSNNVENMSIQINDLDVIPLYYEDTQSYVKKDTLLSGEMYVIKIRKKNTEYIAYFLGQYQPHALCVLTDDENDSYYTKKYFAEKYNCDERNVMLRVEKDSPFVVQKIGEILDYKSGNDFDNIESDSVALQNALYYNRLATTFNDIVTITTRMAVFLDVYTKISYRRQQEQEIKEYVIKSIQHNLDGMTSTITMYRYYPLYFK